MLFNIVDFKTKDIQNMLPLIAMYSRLLQIKRSTIIFCPVSLQITMARKITNRQ